MGKGWATGLLLLNQELVFTRTSSCIDLLKKRTSSLLITNYLLNWAWLYVPIMSTLERLMQGYEFEAIWATQWDYQKKQKVGVGWGMGKSTCLADARPWVQSTIPTPPSPSKTHFKIWIGCLLKTKSKILSYNKTQRLSKLGVAAHACKPSTQKTEGGGIMSLRSACLT
jgi:hypothetical protein